jgi:hypothetical protein
MSIDSPKLDKLTMPLEELMLSVIEERCAAQLALGQHHSAVANCIATENDVDKGE